MADLKRPSLSLATPDNALRVEFRWQHDRFVQKIFVRDMESGVSLEGEPDDPWPISPPVQQLSHELVDGSPVLLGVGAAGRGHWSISVEQEHRPETSAIKFDLACRCKEPPNFLGSTYQLDGSVRLSPADANSLVEALPEPVEPEPLKLVGSIPDGRRVLTVRAGQQRAGTWRWSYWLEV